MAKRFGYGDYVYEHVPGWGKLPDGWVIRDASGLAVDANDNVYVFARGTYPVVVFDKAGKVVAAWGQDIFKNAHGLHMGPDQTLWCVDNGDHTVRQCTLDGKVLRTLGTPNTPSATGDTSSYDTITGGPPFNKPTNAAIAPNGDLFVTDGYGNCKVHRFGPNRELIASFGSAGRGPGQFRLPHGIAVAPDGTLYVGDRENSRLQVFSPTGELKAIWADVHRPDDVLYKDGVLYTAELGRFDDEIRPGDSFGSRVTVRDLNGKVLSHWGDTGDPTAPGNCAAPHGIAVDTENSVYLGEVTYTGRVSRGLVPADCHVYQKWVRVK